MLHSEEKLNEHLNLIFSIQELEYLAEGLEGRSSNPVAVLFDTLLHPEADFGFKYPPVLQWKFEPHHYIPHIVLGKGPPGGAWHVRQTLNFYTYYIRLLIGCGFYSKCPFIFFELLSCTASHHHCIHVGSPEALLG